MRASLRLAIVGTIAAVAIPILGTSVSAAAPHAAFVQGIPGKTVDVCIASNEVRSNLKYGKWFQRDLGSGNRLIRFRKAAPGECTGDVLASRIVNLGADDDLTIVGTAKGSQRVLVFDDSSLGGLGPAAAEVFFAFRHAADFGPLTFKLGALNEILSPSADPVWVKGDEFVGSSGGDDLVVVAVTRPDSDKPLASLFSKFGSPETVALRQEWYAVGTTVRNARIVTFTRVVTD